MKLVKALFAIVLMVSFNTAFAVTNGCDIDSYYTTVRSDEGSGQTRDTIVFKTDIDRRKCHIGSVEIDAGYLKVYHVSSGSLKGTQPGWALELGWNERNWVRRNVGKWTRNAKYRGELAFPEPNGNGLPVIRDKHIFLGRR